METMELPAQEILDCLKMSGRRFQTKAVRDARSSKETITPHLLARLAEVAENPDGFTEGDFSHLYSTFLLAEFREHLAFPLLIQILRLPGKEIENLFPLEFITESAHLILASVFNGDLKALQDLYDDKTIYSDCRFHKGYILPSKRGCFIRRSLLYLFTRKACRSYKKRGY